MSVLTEKFNLLVIDLQESTLGDPRMFAMIVTAILVTLLLITLLLVFLMFQRRNKARMKYQEEANRLKENTVDSLQSILDSIDADIFTTVPATGMLLFTNKNVNKKLNAGEDSPVGNYCYKVFRGGDKPCEFCPCKKLDACPDEPVIWEEYVEDEDIFLLHSDSYIDWPNGERVHLQYTADITASKKTTTMLNRQLELKSLLTSLSQSFLSAGNSDAQISRALREVGEFMGINQILLFIRDKKQSGMRCNYEWKSSRANIPSRLGDMIPLSETLLGIMKMWKSMGKLYVTADEMPDDVRMEVMPYRKNHKNFMAVMIWINDEMYAVLDLARRDGEKWGKDDIYAILLVTDIITNAIQHQLTQEQLIAAKEKAERTSMYKTDFLAKMSHEIRTPMNAIIGMTELALREDTAENKDMHIATVKQAGSNLLAIINDILDFSKIEAGRMEILPSGYSIASLVSDLVSIIRMRALDTQFSFAVNVDSRIPRFLYGDETRLRQAVLNILNNAVKYTEKGSVQFNVYMNPKKEREGADAEIGTASKSGGVMGHGLIKGTAFEGAPTVTDDDKGRERNVNIVFEVKDTGHGIKKADLKKLFSEFTQIEPDKHKDIEGVGLGLVIAHSIVAAMDGEIYVKSEYRKGSTFTIVVPQKYLSWVPIATVKSPQSKNVLLYGNDKVQNDSIAYTLGNLGVHYSIASDDDEFLAKINDNRFNYLFISYNLYNQNKAVIDEHSGKIEVVILTKFGESIPNKELKVLSLPIYCTQAADILNGINTALIDKDEDDDDVEFQASDVRVLIVDDIRTNLKVAEGLLAPYKMKVDLCTGGRDAIKAVQDAAARGERYDLIFMDHKMPVMDGIEATKRIRELGSDDPYFSEVPIVALTANAVSGIEEIYLKNGFSDHLFKPIDTVQLNDILEKWIL